MTDGGARRGSQVAADHLFAVIPEWVLFADVTPQAVRLYGVLARKADNETRQLWWSRRGLALLLRAQDPRVVDRAMAELESIGAVSVTRNRVKADGSPDTNLYRLHTTPWGGVAAPPAPDVVPDDVPPQTGTNGEGVVPSRALGVVHENALGVVPQTVPELIAKRTQSQETDSPGADATGKPPNFGAVFYDAWTAQHGDTPPDQLVKRVARDSAALLREGRNPTTIAAACTEAAMMGHGNVASAYTLVTTATTRRDPYRRAAPGETRDAAARARRERLAAMDAADNGKEITA